MPSWESNRESDGHAPYGAVRGAKTDDARPIADEHDANAAAAAAQALPRRRDASGGCGRSSCRPCSSCWRLGWTWLWSYAADIAGQAEAGWIAREAALGRVYACGAQSIGGFPFSIVSRCDQAAAQFKSNNPPFDVRAAGVTFSAQVFRPTLLNGEITGPVTLADPGQQPVFVANFSDARLRLLGLPPDPEAITVTLQKPRLDRVAGPGSGMIFQADAVDVAGRIISGSARNNPVIEATGHFTAAHGADVSSAARRTAARRRRFRHARLCRLLAETVAGFVPRDGRVRRRHRDQVGPDRTARRHYRRHRQVDGERARQAQRRRSGRASSASTISFRSSASIS